MASSSSSSSARPTIGPAVAGTWYPADGAELARQVESFLESVPPAAEGTPPPRALIAPHAGYVYSGQVAAHGFGLLRGARVRRVLLLGPSHYAGFRGAALPDAAAYRTPLGEVPLDSEALDGLGGPGFVRDDRPFRPEHSLEAEIPFLQQVLEPGWRLLPLLIGGGTSADGARRVAAGLRDVLGPECLVVVSSDFTHYGPRFHYVPFEENVRENLRKLDLGAIERITALDAEGFEAYVAETEATICGRGAIDVLLHLLPDGSTGSLVSYDTSGNQTGDWNHTVSYASVVFG